MNFPPFDSSHVHEGEPSRPGSSNNTETTSPSSTGDFLIRTPSNGFLQFPTLAEILNSGAGSSSFDNLFGDHRSHRLSSNLFPTFHSDISTDPSYPILAKGGVGSGQSPSDSLFCDLSPFAPARGPLGNGGDSGGAKSLDLSLKVEMSASKNQPTGISQDLTSLPIPVNIDTSLSTKGSSNTGHSGIDEEEAFLKFLENGLDKRKEEGNQGSDSFASQPRQPIQTSNPPSNHYINPFDGDPWNPTTKLKEPVPSSIGSTLSPIVPPSSQVPLHTLSPQPFQQSRSSNTTSAFGSAQMPAPYSGGTTSPLRLPSILPPLPSAQSPYHRYHDPLTLHDPRPASAGYPVSLFGNVPLPEMEDNWQGGGGSHSMGLNPGGDPQISGADYAQAVALYENILAAMSHVQPASSASSSTDGMPFDTLLQMSDQGIDLLSGTETALPSHHSPIRQRSPESSSRQKSPIKSSSSHGRKTTGPDKGKVTKCLGCGSTSTPEWRRGPLGPRTLCNACGLVHMKLQRKKRKAEEKAAAAEAAARGEHPSGSA